MGIDLAKQLAEDGVSSADIEKLQRYLCAEYRCSFDDMLQLTAESAEEIRCRLVEAPCIIEEVDAIMAEVFARQSSFI